MSEPLSILKGEIKRLGFVSDEKISLFGYFTGNEKNQTDALSLLDDCDDDEEKYNYLRSLISQPEQPGAANIAKDFDEKFDQVKTILGDVYELSARSEVSKFQGSHYTSKFEIFDLFGLVRIALPRNLLSSENTSYKSQAYLASYRVNKLSNYIYSKKMGENLESSINFIRTLPPDDSNYNKNLHDLANRGEAALKQWRSFENNPNNTASVKRSYLANTRSLSVMLLTSYVLDPKTAIENNQAPFNMILDLDFRGRISGTSISDITIELGEIKSSNGSKAIKKACRQLLLRLAVLSFVIEAMKKDEDTTRCKLIGKIYVPREPEFSIQPIWESGIRFSSSAEYRIDVVKIGEKQ